VDEFMSETEQWEAVKRWLRENTVWIVGGIGIGVLGLAGYRWWEARTERLALEAGAKFQLVIEAFGRSDRTRGLALIDELRRDHPDSPYLDQAELAASRVFVDQNDLAKAAERLERVMRESEDRELALVARLRLARVQLAQNQPDAALATLNAQELGAFAPRYHEVRGDVHLAKGDRAAALKEYRAARAGSVAAVVDTSLLDLKINDLTPPKEAGQPRTADATPAASDG
jgi:predicted negative regulator of RcsB-dependent stress response